MNDCVCGSNPPNDPNPDCERCDFVVKVDRLQAENERLRDLLYKTTHTPFGLCNFSHLHNGGQCGECEACEHTKEVMKSVREALEATNE
jgi:hypothetical protein